MAKPRFQPIDYEDWRSSLGDAALSEWVDGSVITPAPARQFHFELTNLLIGVLLLIVTRRKLGRVFHAPVEMRLPRSAREPDLLFLSTANLDHLDGTRVNGPADLAIEVVSDDSVVRDRMVKFAEYEAAGVREYWVIDPRPGQRWAEAWLLDEDGRYRGIPSGTGGRIASVAIPGFVFDPRWMAPEHLADPGLAMAEASALLDAGTSPPDPVGTLPTPPACRPISREDWRAWTDEHGLSEWVDGEVTILGTRTTRHQQLLLWLVMLVDQLVRPRGGRVLIAPFEMALPRSSREPDLLVVTPANLDRLGPERLEGPADLVVEIVSDDTDRRDQVEKRAEYEAVGVREYWIVDPREGQRTCLALARDAEGRLIPVEPDAGGRIHSRVLAGFWLDPTWLWQDPLPDSLRTLDVIAPGSLGVAPEA